MKYFKDNQNKVHALDDDRFVNLLPKGVVEISEAEAIELQKPPPETPEQAAKRLEAALDAHIDSVAHSYGYNDIGRMASYSTSNDIKFGKEGRAAVDWRDACYNLAISIQKDVKDGKRDIPTEAELIAEMPLFESFL